MTFKTDLGPIEIKTDRITAILFNPALRRKPPPTGNPLRAWAGFSDGSRLLATRLLVDGDSLKLTAAGQTLAAPRSSLVFLQPLAGRAVYLSDLKPAEYRQTPFLDSPLALSADRNVTGGMLRARRPSLPERHRRPQRRPAGLQHLPSPFGRGAGGEGRQRRFDAQVAIDDSTAGQGSVIFRVLVDGQERFRQPDPPRRRRPVPVSVDVRGAKKLELVVDYADRADVLDHADWLDAGSHNKTRRTEGTSAREGTNGPRDFGSIAMRTRWNATLIADAGRRCVGGSGVRRVGYRVDGVLLVALCLCPQYEVVRDDDHRCAGRILFVGLLVYRADSVAVVRLVLNKDPETYNQRFCHDQSATDHGLALGDYHQAYGCFPPAYVADKSGRPTHSWRVLILPYLHRSLLYKQYNFNEPWDGPNNKKLLTARPGVYYLSKRQRSPPIQPPPARAMWPWSGPTRHGRAKKPKTAAEVAPLNRTIMVVEVTGVNIPWTEPRDLSLDSAATASHERVTVSSRHLPLPDSSFICHKPESTSQCPMDSVQFLPGRAYSTADESHNLLKIGGFPRKNSTGKTTHRPHGMRKALQRRPLHPFTIWRLSVGLLLFRALSESKNTCGQLARAEQGRNHG